MQVILIGPPGAGKGTQATLLQDRLRLPHISSGDLLRAAVKRKTETGLQAKQYMDRGELVPDGIVVRVIEERVRQRDCRDGELGKGTAGEHPPESFRLTPVAEYRQAPDFPH